MSKDEIIMPVSHPIAKLVVGWLAAIGVNSWSSMASMMAALASFLAALYTLCILLEFIWQKWVRPCLENREWIRRRKRRRTDANNH